MEGEKLHPQIQKCIVLSDDIRLDSPVGFMVFYYKSFEFDYVIKYNEREARDFAHEQAVKAWEDMPEGTNIPKWPIYGLWATDWPEETDEYQTKRNET